jgi:hypothetical protein
MMGTYEYIDLREYIIVYFKSVRVFGEKQGSINDGYNTTEFRKYSDGRICAFLNGKADASQTTVPAELRAKLADLDTYDVLLQEIEDKHILCEIREYREGHYDKKDKKKGKFMR